MNWKVAGGVVGALAALFLLGNNRAMAYVGGKPAGLIKLTTIDGIVMSATMAPKWLAMKAAAKKAGINLYATSGFRTMEKQAELYAKWIAGLGNKAAVPGKSNHQGGRAIDIADDAGLLSYTSRGYIWLLANGWRFGFNNVEGSSIDEPWHWVLDFSIKID